MKIEIHYQKLTDIEPQYIELTPEEYFDPLESGETFDADGIEKFDHAEEYLNVTAEDLRWTEIRIQGTNNSPNVRTEYYKGGHSMWHRKDSDGYEEICILTQISETKTHISRAHKNPNSFWMVNYSGIIEDLADGSQTEVKFVP